MTEAYHVLMDKNNNACVDKVTDGKHNATNTYVAILDKNKFLETLDYALARARIMGKNPDSVYMYTNGRNPEIVRSDNDYWIKSSLLLYKIATSQRYINEPLFKNIHLYFDDSEIAALHEDSKKEKANRRERYRRGAY